MLRLEELVSLSSPNLFSLLLHAQPKTPGGDTIRGSGLQPIRTKWAELVNCCAGHLRLPLGIGLSPLDVPISHLQALDHRWC